MGNGRSTLVAAFDDQMETALDRVDGLRQSVEAPIDFLNCLYFTFSLLAWQQAGSYKQAFCAQIVPRNVGCGDLSDSADSGINNLPVLNTRLRFDPLPAPLIFNPKG